jgi:LPS O-antigen subunit length determinant protein (WzzB/FepE family)
MSAADYLSVDKVIKLVNQQGFSSVTISDISTTSKTAMGVKARLDAIVKYVKSKVADSNVRISIVAPKGKTYLNTFAVS